MFSNNHSKFYKYISSKKSIRNLKITLNDTEDKLIVDPKQIANQFNTFFISTYEATNFVSTNINTSSDYEIIIITESHVKTALKLLKNSSGTGIDKIPIFFWVQVCDSVAKFLSKLFKSCIANKELPADWNIAIVHPLFKGKGSRLSTTNYRPISILNSLRRIFEAIIYTMIKDKLEPRIAKCQYGFKEKSSTMSNLLYTYSLVYSSIEKHREVDIITIDFNKAFDKIDHTILLMKLSNYIPSGFLNIISLLLLNRRQVVQIEDSLSEALFVTSGIPQGSILSPLLFNLFMNDLFDIRLYNFIVAYADDLKNLWL